ncbi:alpha/beta hydrolase [Nocardia sp. NPDC050799]|uniref:alpha/beta fold hydrolase n=1 Tax=Nocardia TaxID=1817 RepID=UPI0007A7346C|nr:alpha/beta hydrolase [Nocardia fusca]
MDYAPTASEDLVLVHGAWHGGWTWQPVASYLRAFGHRVSAPTSPGLGINDDPRGVTLADCVNSLVDHVDSSDRTGVTLIAHSWGGFVAAGAAPRLASRLKRIVFWSAFVPEEGRSLLDEVPPEYVESFTALAAASPDNTVAPPAESFHESFMADASPEAAAVVHAILRPQPFRTFTDEPVDGEKYRLLDIPLEYVLSSDDIALPPGKFGWAPRMPDRCEVAPTLVAGSHESMFTRPAELAEALLSVCVAR